MSLEAVSDQLLVARADVTVVGAEQLTEQSKQNVFDAVAKGSPLA